MMERWAPEPLRRGACTKQTHRRSDGLANRFQASAAYWFVAKAFDAFDRHAFVRIPPVASPTARFPTRGEPSNPYGQADP